MKTMMKLFVLLAVMLAAIGQPTAASALGGPVFDYPVDGQTLDFEGWYLFRVHPIPSAQGYLWGFFQNGVMVWENYRDEGTLSGNEYAIQPGTVAHSRFVPGDVEVWVRGWVDNQWTDATVITIHLVPRSVYEVTIDIKPGDPSNQINRSSKASIQVAILSTSDFEAPTMVDQTSLTFGRTGHEASLVSCIRKSRDVNADGLPDLVCEFSIRASNFQAGNTVGILLGQTLDGLSIRGSDTVRILK